MRILIILIVLCNAFNVYAQKNTCLSNVTFHTADLGNGQMRLNLPLMFTISSDSIRILSEQDSAGKTNALMNVSFKILHKSCKWNNDFTDGIAVYRVVSTDSIKPRKATINITVKKGGGNIKLFYEDSEARVFTLSKEQPFFKN